MEALGNAPLHSYSQRARHIVPVYSVDPHWHGDRNVVVWHMVMAHDFKKGDMFVIPDTASALARGFIDKALSFGLREPYTVRKIYQDDDRGRMSIYIEGMRGVWLPIELAHHVGGPW